MTEPLLIEAETLLSYVASGNNPRYEENSPEREQHALTWNGLVRRAETFIGRKFAYSDIPQQFRVTPRLDTLYLPLMGIGEVEYLGAITRGGGLRIIWEPAEEPQPPIYQWWWTDTQKDAIVAPGYWFDAEYEVSCRFGYSAKGEGISLPAPEGLVESLLTQWVFEWNSRNNTHVNSRTTNSGTTVFSTAFQKQTWLPRVQEHLDTYRRGWL